MEEKKDDFCEIYNQYIKEFTQPIIDLINNNIINEVILKEVDPQLYHKQEIKRLKSDIEEMEKENEEYLKLCPNSTRRHYEPLYGDAHCITYEEELEENKKRIQEYKKQIAENKRELEKLKNKNGTKQ